VPPEGRPSSENSELGNDHCCLIPRQVSNLLTNILYPLICASKQDCSEDSNNFASNSNLITDPRHVKVLRSVHLVEVSYIRLQWPTFFPHAKNSFAIGPKIQKIPPGTIFENL
jgi:hypothetical protein